MTVHLLALDTMVVPLSRLVVPPSANINETVSRDFQLLLKSIFFFLFILPRSGSELIFFFKYVHTVVCFLNDNNSVICFYEIFEELFKKIIFDTSNNRTAAWRNSCFAK